MLKEFREFILRGNLVDLAVAVVLGTAFGAVVTSFVKNLVTPLIAAIGGQPDFSQLTFTINGSKFFYGDFINALMARFQPAPAVDVKTRPCPECVSDIPIAATRCAFCTTKVGPPLDAA
jgi:large conductance mechanosensitive channel